jgi:hypothetical protein
MFKIKVQTNLVFGRNFFNKFHHILQAALESVQALKYVRKDRTNLHYTQHTWFRMMVEDDRYVTKYIIKDRTKIQYRTHTVKRIVCRSLTIHIVRNNNYTKKR